MPKITATLKELRNAEVRFISLVDRAATRIPFRVLKKDETEMDLSKIFKSEPAPKAEVVAIGVFNHQDAQMAEAVKQAIADAGFSVDKVVKSEDGETLSYVQKDEEGDTFVKLSDQVVVVTKGFYGMPGNGTFAEMVAAQGFYPTIYSVADVLRRKMEVVMAESDDQKTAASKVEQVLGEFKSYVMGLVNNLPSSAFIAMNSVGEAIQKREIVIKQEQEQKESEVEVQKQDQPSGVSEETTMGKLTFEEVYKMSKEGMSEEEMKKKMKESGMSDDESGEMTGKCKAKKAEEEAELAKKAEEKSELQKLTELVQSIATKVDSFGTQVAEVVTKVNEVVTKQENQQKVLDDVVQKSETLSVKLSTTVAAAPPSGDQPARETTQKREEDPRTGCFDTGFMRRKQY